MTDLLSVTGGALRECTLLAREESGEGVFLLEFAVEPGGGTPEAPSPGQFYQIRCGSGREHMLRRPLSAHGAKLESGMLKVSFLVEIAGWGTEKLCSLVPGERVSMLGPLGRGFVLDGVGKALLIAGGIGVAPLFFLAREMEKAGVAYDLLAGFNTGDKYYRPLDDLNGSVVACTEDGSLGKRGLACDALAGYLARGYDAVYACGPEAMMSEAAGKCEVAGVPCQVSLDSRMACGIGACRGCVREGSDGRNLCVCSEGPVFDSRKVSWRK